MSTCIIATSGILNHNTKFVIVIGNKSCCKMIVPLLISPSDRSGK